MLQGEKEEMLLRICRMYYEQNVSQDIIAKKFHLSRSYISKLLKEAMSLGLIEIRIKDSMNSESELEKRIKELFALKKVIVVPVATARFEKKLEVVGSTVGRYLHSILSDDDVIGVSWGLTLAACAGKLNKKDLKNVKVTQLKGGLLHLDEVGRANEIVQKFAEAYNAEAFFLPLPLIVDSVQIKKAIVRDRKIDGVLKLGVKANIALFAVGEFGSNSALVRAGYFTDTEVRDLQERGIVGDVCGRLIDIEGNIVANEFDARTIGIPLNLLREKEYSILVAAESSSVKGVYGALKGRYASVFITDEITAKEIIRLNTGLGRKEP